MLTDRRLAHRFDWLDRQSLADITAGLFLRAANIDDLARFFDRHVKGLIAFQTVQRQVIGLMSSGQIRSILWGFCRT